MVLFHLSIGLRSGEPTDSGFKQSHRIVDRLLVLALIFYTFTRYLPDHLVEKICFRGLVPSVKLRVVVPVALQTY